MRRSVLVLVIVSLCGLAARAQEIHPDIHYVPTSNSVIKAMFRLTQPMPGDVVYDLGSGDGRIVIAFAKRFGIRGVGVEIDPALVKKANENARKAHVEDKVRFVQADLFETDLSPATIVTLYLSPATNLRLREKLRTELRPGARVVSNRFDMGDWKPDAQVKAFGRQVFLWRIR